MEQRVSPWSYVRGLGGSAFFCPLICLKEVAQWRTPENVPTHDDGDLEKGVAWPHSAV